MRVTYKLLSLTNATALPSGLNIGSSFGLVERVSRTAARRGMS